jgi:tetrapyrrole methylase family protein / MazG family protein
MSGEKFERLLGIMDRLRSPGGCPWDREQTLRTLRAYLIEEAYEALDAIEREDWPHLAEELGDLQLQIVFQARIASETGLFEIGDVLDAISEKLVRRHPHVFGDESAATSGDVLVRWQEIKAAEKAAKAGAEPASILDETPRHQPAVLEAYDLGKRAARKGFDWRHYDELLDKLREEAGELAQARESGDADEVEDEVGDLLFMAVNIARFLTVNPELALKRANGKFRRRFAYIESELRAQGRALDDSSLEEMEVLWQKAKSA